MQGFVANVAVALFGLSLLGTLVFFVGYPAVLSLVSLFKRERARPSGTGRPAVTLVVVARNAEEIIEDKVRNTLSLSYPKDKLHVIFYSDGSTDRTEQIVRRHEGPHLRLLRGNGHEGKIACMNDAVDSCTGEVLVFSDADALLDPDAIEKLVGHYEDDGIGGVCGQRVVGRKRTGLGHAQARYISFDSAIKRWEAKIGSVTSNDGKVYSIRRELFRRIPPAVTDDLYVALTVIRLGRRFVFEPEARAHIRMPSRSPAHEAERRRRIVSQSLRGIYLSREILNPFRFGWYSFALAVNKIGRRMLPLFLLTMFGSSLGLAAASPAFAVLWLGQVAFYGLAWTYRLPSRRPREGRVRKAAGLAYYFTVGQYGTLLGILSFLEGRPVEKWDPVKTDTKARRA